MTDYLSTDVTNFGNRPNDGPLRPGGQSSGLPVTNKGDLPDTLSPCVSKMQKALTLVRDLWHGTEKVRDRSVEYLPKAPGEDPDNYADRLKRSVFFNVFGHTIIGLAGFIFRREPTLGDDVPPQIVEHMENVDLAGTHFDVFAHDLLQDAMIAGHAAILVDYPDTGGQKLTLADEQAFRPYWLPIKKENILSWRTTNENGSTVLTQIVLRECVCVPDGAFGEKEQVQYRVLWREMGKDGPVVGFSLLEITDDKKVVVVKEGLYRNQTEIPVAEIPTSGRKGMFESNPPLLDLAYLNVAHYQQLSDYFTSIHKTCVPIFVTIGLDQQDGQSQLVLGPNAAVDLPIGGDAKYVSHDGAALGECKQALDDLKGDMASLGIAMLSQQKRVAETDEAKRIGKADTDSSLSVTARGLEDGLERALQFHANYMKIEDGGSVSVNRDFENMKMAPDMLAQYINAVSSAGLPKRILLEAMQEGGLIPPDANLDEIEMEMNVNEQAAADAKATELELQAKNGDMQGAPPKQMAA